MSLSAIIKDSWGHELFAVKSAPAFYTAAAHNILVISGGPVHILALVEYLDTAMTNATTTAITINAVAMQTGAVAIGPGVANRMVVSPLSCAAAVAKVAPALVTQCPSLLAMAAARIGIIAVPGNITVTFATVMAAADRYSLIALYRKLTPASLIS